MSGRKVELDEVTVPAPLLEISSMMPTPISEEVNDDDHETHVKLLPNLVGQPEYVPHQSGTATQFWKSCY